MTTLYCHIIVVPAGRKTLEVKSPDELPMAVYQAASEAHRKINKGYSYELIYLNGELVVDSCPNGKEI
jgi:hypothetical protein